MSFVMMRKKRFKFLVNFELEELNDVPFVSGILFAKVRLIDGGSFTELSTREEVCDHCVKWRAKLQFPCKATASPTTGVLDPCVCRVSVRKELKGGKSFQKLGFADINLSEFAGAGVTCRRYILEGYDSKRRQDNSTLKVNIDMSLLSGDPCFKAPSPSSSSHGLSTFHVSLPGDGICDDLLKLDNKADDGCESIGSGSSGFGSLTRREKSSTLTPESVSPHTDALDSTLKNFEKGHSRSSSYASQTSKGSTGYAGSVTHSRQASSEMAIGMPGHIRNPSSCSFSSDPGRSERRRKLDADITKDSRIDSTRVDTDQLIEELLQSTDFNVDESAENSGLQLFIAKDGTASLGGSLKNSSNRGLKKVIMDTPGVESDHR